MNPFVNYETLRQEINAEALKSGRDPKTVELIAVSKNFTWKDIVPVYQAGGRTFGENRVQEALTKKAEAPIDVNWHFIGNLQKNKVRKVINNFELIHSIDYFELAEVLSKLSVENNSRTNILLQVNISGEQSKQGFSVEEVKILFPQLKELAGINIQGLMTIAPLTGNLIQIRHCFSGLRLLKEELELKFGLLLPKLSMGMTNDYKIAIQEGATLLRIGTAIFGTRLTTV